MVEFEPPKPKALSDAELHRAITLLGSSAEGLANSERLISEQALLREQDSEALSQWIADLQADNSPQALLALKKLALDVLPANIEEVDSAAPIEPSKPEVPIFTTEIPIIGRRARSRKKDVARKIVPGLASWLLVALVNVLIATWLELTIVEAMVSFAIGLSAGGLVLALMKSHSLHPMIRSAAVFGGWGVYLGAALAMSFTSLVFLAGVLHILDNDLLVSVIPGYRTDVLVIALSALLLGQLLPRTWHWWTLLVAGSISALLLFATGQQLQIASDWFAYAPLSDSYLYSPAISDWAQVGWASFAVGLMSVVVFAFALPHSQTKAWSFALQVPLGVGLSVGLILVGQSALALTATLGLIFLAMTFAGRDLTARPIGRWAGAAFLIPVFAMPILGYVNGPAVAVLAAVIVLLFTDQLFRRTPLHIPSLDTSYGFYGSFQPLTWITLLLAAPFGVEQIQELVLPNSDFTVYELALIFGLAIGVTFAVLRIFVIRAQDREIRNVEFRNMNLDNLLGL